MNTRLLRKIQKHILAQPKKLFNMDTWERVVPADKPEKPCGTAHCIGGWACALTQNPVGAWNAQNLLKLTDEQTERLFYPHSWPKKFLPRKWDDNWERITPKLAARRIDHFIATKGAE